VGSLASGNGSRAQQSRSSLEVFGWPKNLLGCGMERRTGKYSLALYMFHCLKT